jgi:hypothetical protein
MRCFRTRIARCVGLPVALAALFAAGRGEAGIELTPESNMDIYEAGGNSDGPGNPPTETALVFDPGDVVRFPSVIGSTDCHANGSDCLPTGPEGNLGADVNVGAQNALSGIQYRGAFSLPLMGVFLGPALPVAAPVALDFRDAEDFGRIDPLLGQIFWIGDGRTGTGSGDIQEFGIPSGATRLSLGFIDVAHGDNIGGLLLDLEIVPEPTSDAIGMGAIAALAALARRARGVA